MRAVKAGNALRAIKEGRAERAGKALHRLYTAAGETVAGAPWEETWNDYPRPQMTRERWMSLNGEWTFSAGGRKMPIRVPFCPESLLSGIAPEGGGNGRNAGPGGPADDEDAGPGSGTYAQEFCGRELTYMRAFEIPADWAGGRVLLHFGAVSRAASVFVNGELCAEHDNGYLPFCADITQYLRPGTNSLTVKAVNDLSTDHPWGKQKLRRGGMWYTPVSGIWQSVWLEPVPRTYIRRVAVRTGTRQEDESGTGGADGASCAAWALVTAEIAGDLPAAGAGDTPGSGPTAYVRLDGRRYLMSSAAQAPEAAADAGDPAGAVCAGDPAGAESCAQVFARIPLERVRPWSPEDPQLYPFEVALTSGAAAADAVAENAGSEGACTDRVGSYFAVRSLSIERDPRSGLPRLCLNGKPYFFNALLDQGYWSDGLYTPAAPECYAEDILAAKSLGFNTLRKHIKIEPERFYYDCDRLGMVVFQDMVNCGPYRYIRDTVLPTIGIMQAGDRRPDVSAAARKNFIRAMEGTVRLLESHPSVCLWTIFNEGWGQFDADAMYERLRAIDDTRFIDSTSGWFRRKKSDVESIHNYFRRLRLGRLDMPQLLSEYGGWSLPVAGHRANTEKTYGYRQFTDRETFVRALREHFLEQVSPLKDAGLSGAVYTQLSDVEDETNGLLTWDRRVRKVLPEEWREVRGKLEEVRGRPEELQG